MCIGVTNDVGDSIFDIDKSPFSTLKRRDIKPTSQGLKDEVARRCGLSKIKTPKCNNWSVERVINWLRNNPITGENEVAFLNKEVSDLAQKIERAIDKTVHVQQQDGNGNWRGKVPHLRLIHCLIQDDIKMPYLRRADAMTREQLDV
jgi:hypothetical protein